MCTLLFIFTLTSGGYLEKKKGENRQDMSKNQSVFLTEKEQHAGMICWLIEAEMQPIGIINWIKGLNYFGNPESLIHCTWMGLSEVCLGADARGSQQWDVTCTVVVRLLSEVNGASSLEGNETLSPTLPGHRAERSNKWVFSSGSFSCVSHWAKCSHLIVNSMSFYSISQCIVFITNCSEISRKKMYLILLNLIFNSVYLFKSMLFVYFGAE